MEKSILDKTLITGGDGTVASCIDFGTKVARSIEILPQKKLNYIAMKNGVSSLNILGIGLSTQVVRRESLVNLNCVEILQRNIIIPLTLVLLYT